MRYPGVGRGPSQTYIFKNVTTGRLFRVARRTIEVPGYEIDRTWVKVTCSDFGTHSLGDWVQTKYAVSHTPLSGIRKGSAMTTYYCSVRRPDGTIVCKRVSATDRRSAVHDALRGEPRGSQTTARPEGQPVGVRDLAGVPK